MKILIQCLVIAVLLFIMATFLSGCSRTTAYIGVYDNLSGQQEFLGDDPVAIVRVDYNFNEKYSCSFVHWSHYFQGTPFDNRPEGSVDLVGCGLKIGWE